MASILKTSNGKWRAQVRHTGAKTQSRTFSTKAQAERWARQTEIQHEDGWIDAGSAKRVTMAELFTRYEREIMPGKKGTSQEGYRMTMLTAQFGALSLLQLTADRVTAFALERLKVVESDTVRRDLSLLSAVVEVARSSWGHRLAHNPVREAVVSLNRQRVLRRKVERERRLYPGEYRRLLRGLRDNPQMRIIVRLILETALRRGEVVKLRPADLRPDGLQITDDKTGKTTTIPISRRARRLIERVDPDGFGVRGDSITQAFDRACKRAGIEDLRLHDLRREATSRYFEKGLTIPEVQSITRHSGWASLKIYSRPKRQTVTDKLG